MSAYEKDCFCLPSLFVDADTERKMFWTVDVKSQAIPLLKSSCLLLTNGALGFAWGILLLPFLLDTRRLTTADMDTIADMLDAGCGGHMIGAIASEFLSP